MKRRSRKTMFIIIGILISLIGILMIFFNIPCSKTKTEFDMTAKNLIAEAEHHEDIFREEDILGNSICVNSC